MPAAAHLLHDATPAWPTLLGVQFVVLAGLVGLGWRTRPVAPEPPPPIEQRLRRLDLSSASAAVDAALVRERDPGALTVDDQRHLGSFLALSASAAQLEVLALRWVDGPALDGLQTVDAIVALRGDIYDFPVFIDAVHHQRAIATLAEITVQARPGGLAELQLRLRFHRPPTVDTAWIAPRLASSAPGADRAAPVLEQAAQLAAWRDFHQRAQALAQRADAVREQVAVELPAQLMSLRRSGGTLTWVAGGELHIRRD